MKSQNKFKSIYCFTGKGGVGKSVIALALAHCLATQAQGRKVHFFSWEANSSAEKLLRPLGINDGTIVDDSRSVIEYLQRKLGKIVGNWIGNTSFFSSVMQVVPSIRYMLSLEEMIKSLTDSSDKVIGVFDAPSSGHMLVMFKSFESYIQILKKGVVFEDILHAQSLLRDPQFCKINLITLPSVFACNEALETQENLVSMGWKKKAIEIYLNQSFLSLKENIPSTQMPSFFSKKIFLEEKILSDFGPTIQGIFPYTAHQDLSELVQELSGMSNLMKLLI
ncbi:MAG: hypothetical protein HQK53_05260 [Oligoflexia bacterium]|nr:hypothetical protein [Oligoflexia bacterium]